MEGLLAEILINASWAGATVIFIWKIGGPVTQQPEKKGGSALDSFR